MEKFYNIGTRSLFEAEERLKILQFIHKKPSQRDIFIVIFFKQSERKIQNMVAL